MTKESKEGGQSFEDWKRQKEEEERKRLARRPRRAKGAANRKMQDVVTRAQARKKDSIETVQLANGKVEAKPLVLVTMLSLESLLESNPIAFHELTMKCRDDEHTFFGNTEEVLKQSALVQEDGKIHQSIKNIVVSAVKGEDLDMMLGSPLRIS